MPDDIITKIEARLDEDYKQCFPQSMGWEKAAAHLLIAYDYMVGGADVRTVDGMKYALMHTLRWGCAESSQPFRGYPDDFDPRLFEKCRSALRRGTEYVGIWGAFNLYHNGVVSIERIDEHRVEFTGARIN
ncbi:MAG: hypothetical protein RBS80_29775 [Thermoguttaceae bacterium]|jgi:hypothetical protein|nr:hypothetical protein [Thermoguttaceae bacterium]